MERWIGKIAVVTGASSGIGASISESLVRAGVKVIGVARRVEKVEALKQKLLGERGELIPMNVDITQEDAIVQLFAWIKKTFGGTDILINNAGIFRDPGVASLSDGNSEEWRKMFDTNLIGLCVATREAVRQMKERDVNGHIIHISSIAGCHVKDSAGKFLTTYAATKFGVQACAEVLRHELNSSSNKIKVSTICPASVRTEIFTHTSFAIDTSSELSWMLEPKEVSEAIMFILSRGPNVVVQQMVVATLAELDQ